MSNSIDQRIVEMQFDNSQFEKGVATTLQSLKSLENGLTLKDGVSGLDNVQKSVDKISFKGIEGETGRLSETLSGLKDTALNVFDHIANGVGTVVKGFTIAKGIMSAGIAGLAIQGGWNRASNINKAAFKLDAMGVGWENVQLQVQKSVDGTAYSLDAAASAAAMFASSGVEVNKTLAETTTEGDQMQQSLKAVANLASVSGSSFEQMSDIFAKVAAQGKLSGMQVQSLAFASVDAAGIFRRQLGWSAEEFAEAQRKGLIDFQTFVDVVNKEYGDAAGLANKSFDGALANMRSALSRTTADLFQYGQLGMIPVFNGIRESINMFNNALNPLMRTWTEFDKATGKSVLMKGTLIRGFEDLAKEVGRAFHDFGGKWDPEMDNVSKGSKRVGAYIEMTYVRYNRLFKMIADGLEGPISEFNAGVYDLAHGLLDMGSIFREFVRLGLEALSPIGMAFQDIFGQGSFAKATKSFKDGVWTILETFANLKIADGYINTLRASFQVLFTIVRGIGSVAFKVLGSAIKSFFSILASFGTFMGGVFNALDSLRTSGSNIGKSIGNALSPIVDFFKNIPVLGSVIDMFSKIPEGIGKFIDAVKGGEGSFDALSGFLSGVESNFSSIGDDIAGFFLSVSDGVASFATSFKDKAAEKVTVFMEKVDGVWRKVSPGLKDMRDNIGEIFASIGDAISQAFPDSNPIETILGNIGNVMGGAFETVKSAASGIADFLKQTFADSELSAEPFLEFFGSIKDSLVEFFSGDDEKFDFGALISNIGKAASSLVEEVAPKFSTFVEKVTSPIRDSLLPVLDQVEKKIESIGGPFERLGETISKTGDLIADFSLEKLFSFGKVDSGSGVDGSGLAKMGNDTYEAVSNLESIMDTVSHPVESIKKTIGDIFGGLGDSIHDIIGKISEGDIKQFISILASMGISAGVVVGLLNMTKAVRAVSETASAIGGFVKSISGVFEGITDTLSTIKTSIKIHMFLELAIAVAIIAASIIALTMIPNKDKLGEAVGIVAAVMGALAGISLLFGFLSANKKNFNFRGVTFITASIMQLALAIAAVVGVLALAAMLQQYGDLSAGLVPVFGVLTVFVLLSALMSKIKVANIATAGATMMAIAQSLLVIFVAIELFAHIPDQDLEKAMPIIMKLMVLMGLIAGMIGFMTGLSKGSSMMSGMAGAFLGIAATMIVLAGVVKILGEMDKGDLDKGIGAIIGITVMVGLLAALIAGLSTLGGGTGANIAAPLLAMSAAIVALGLAIGGLAIVSNMVGSGNMGMALVALSVGLLALGGAMALMSLAAPQMLTVAAAMMVLVVAVGALSLFAMAMSTYGEQILAGVKAIAPALLLFVGALLAVGIIGKFFADGIFGIAAAFALLGVGLIAIAAALLIGVSAMAMFASVSGQFVPAFQQFGQAMIDIFSQGNLAIEMFGVSVMMGILGAACLILGVGLGVLTVALWGFGKVLPDAAAAIGTALTNMTNFITQNKEAIANAVRSMLEVAVKAITDFAMNIFNEAKQIPNKISEGLKNNPDAIRNGVRDIVGDIGKTFAETLPEVGNILLQLLGQIATGLFEGIARAVTGPVEWLDHKLFELTNGLMGHSGAAQAATEAVGTAAVNGLTTSTQNFGDATIAQIDKMIGDVQAKSPEAAAASGEMATGMVDAVDGATQGFDFIKALNISPETLAGGFDSVKAYLEGQGIELPDNVIQGIADGLNGFELTSLMQENGSFDINGLADQLGIDAQMLGPAFQSGTEQGFASVDITGIVTGSQTIDMDAIQAQFTEAGTAAGTALSTAITESINVDGAGPIEKVASSIKAASSSIESAGRSLGKSADTGFKAGTKDMKTKGKSAGNEAINGLRSQSSSANSAGRSVGAALGNGLAAGIRAALPSVRAAANAIVAEANRAARAKAEMNSPSKVWMRIGHGLGEGLILGMDHMHRSVGEAAGEMFDPAISAAMSQAGYLTGLLEDIDDQPTIRPVLDLTDYEAGIARMQGLNASAPMNSAQWANRLYGTGDAGGNLTNNNTPITINLNYEAGDDANAMVRDICRGLQVKSLMEA